MPFAHPSDALPSDALCPLPFAHPFRHSMQAFTFAKEYALEHGELVVELDAYIHLHQHLLKPSSDLLCRRSHLRRSMR